jgi:S1-C subfamily serine protease
MALIMKKLIRRMAGAALGVVLLTTMPLWAGPKGASAPANGGRFTPGYLGVYLGNVSPQAAAQLNLKQTAGAEIMGVDRDAPAGKVGLRPHDVIVGVDGRSVTSGVQLRNILHGMPAGRTINLKLMRDGKLQDVAVKLASRAEVEATAWPEGVIFTDGFPVTGSGGNVAGLPLGSQLGPNVKLQEFAMLGCDGLNVEPIGKQLASYFGVVQGAGLLVRNVVPHSVAAGAGLQAGDVITAANGMPSSTLRGWLMVISQNQGKSVKLKVIRNHKLKWIQYTPGGRRQQSQLALPEELQRGGPAAAVGDWNAGMGWVWTESFVSRSPAF